MNWPKRGPKWKKAVQFCVDCFADRASPRMSGRHSRRLLKKRECYGVTDAESFWLRASGATVAC
jgi:hypothetical protein